MIRTFGGINEGKREERAALGVTSWVIRRLIPSAYQLVQHGLWLTTKNFTTAIRREPPIAPTFRRQPSNDVATPRPVRMALRWCGTCTAVPFTTCMEVPILSVSSTRGRAIQHSVP